MRFFNEVKPATFRTMRKKILVTFAAFAVFCIGVGAAASEGEVATATPKTILIPTEYGTPAGAGPTIFLDYNFAKKNIRMNPVYAFMYFVPLISPTLVESKISKDNKQFVQLTSYDKKVNSHSFSVVCKFKINGKGIQKTVFDPETMIKYNTKRFNGKKKMKYLLGYIQFRDGGIGSVNIKGKIKDSVATVTSVNVLFNAGGKRSPVTVGLYNVKAVDGQYKYENKCDEIVTRVNTLGFKKNGKEPKMTIKLASIDDKEGGGSLWGMVKAAVANVLLIEPIEIDKIGNAAMLDFGDALLGQRKIFTFPPAQNLIMPKRPMRSKTAKVDSTTAPVNRET